MRRYSLPVGSLALLWWVQGAMVPAVAAGPDAALREPAIAAMRRAAAYYHDRVAVHGGYVYYYSLDLERRLGEGAASSTQVWVQPPGTPTVGMAFLTAYRATGDRYYLDYARDAAEALAYGQLASGGWTNSIDFDPRGKGVAQYRNGQGRGRNYSTLDDGISQSALRFLIQADRAFEFKHEAIHESARVALEALLAAQFPNGAFPQVWSGPVSPHPTVAARYPDYDWRTENRIKEYWNLYTLNDDLCGYVSDTLLEAAAVYDDPRARTALTRLGDFLVLAQMPAPQPAWAQQYDYEMRPVWARKFEPPAVCGRESQDAIAVLMKVYRQTGEKRYLQPIAPAIAYLRSSLLPDGRMARYYELRTNKPLYMTDRYELTHDDSRVPSHYGWKTDSRLDELEREYQALAPGAEPKPAAATGVTRPTDDAVRAILAALDDAGRWPTEYEPGMQLVGQPKFRPGDKFLSSEVFSHHLATLSRYVEP